MESIQQYMQTLGQTARTASRAMARANTATKNAALRQMAVLIEQQADVLKAENTKDLEQARAKGLDAAFIDRLTRPTKRYKPWWMACAKSPTYPTRSAK